MKRILLKISLLLYFFSLSYLAMASQPDSAYLFSYSTLKNKSSNGLHFAWSIDKKNWHAIGPEMRFLFCDYGRWGSEKRLISPFLFRDNEARWHCIWSVNEYDHVFAHASSDDLIYWYPQTYPLVSPGNCLMPEICFNNEHQIFEISWLNNEDSNKLVYGNSTRDFKSYTATIPLEQNRRINNRVTLEINGNSETGTVHKISWFEINKLLERQKIVEYNQMKESESYKDDVTRFAALKVQHVSLNISPAHSKKISNELIGVFFEDINYAADGGLYAELIQNRDFEYQLSDKDGRDKSWTSTKAWRLEGDNATLNIDTVSPVHQNNKHFAVLNSRGSGVALCNDGYNGIVLKKGESYLFSLIGRTSSKKVQRLIVRLISKEGKIIGQTEINIAGGKWNRKFASIMSKDDANEAYLALIPAQAGEIQLDMISLFPQKTFKNRPNGLRNDLAQMIADLHPKFVRFPGGCVAHGDGLGNIYHWKNTIGPIETRKPQRNLWGYHQTAGLGYFEYFQFCEDIGAAPVPVVAAGVPCQNSHTGGAGQQGGIPMCGMDHYVQDVLDLIEYANGDARKTYWGKKRADAGHPEPFNLKYVGIGNEDLINDIFEERFALIYKAVREKYPEITVIGTVGPFWEGTDYTEGWKIADKMQIPMVDEHYYNSPGWFIHHQNFYDSYDRSKSKVYLGEWASRGNQWYNALSEALYLTSLERNADVVTMASYAPLLAKEGFTQWNPDLIYFNNSEVKPTVNYFVQQLYGRYTGDNYCKNELIVKDQVNAGVLNRIASSVVADSRTGELIIRLVNLLPVPVKTSIHINDFQFYQPDAERILMKGKPDARNIQQVSEKFTLSVNTEYEQPEYSFTVIRVKKQ